MRPSKRFTPGKWTEYLVPAVLALLLLALIATLLIVLLFSVGLL